MTAPTDAYHSLAERITTRALELGFQQLRITDADPAHHAAHLSTWLNKQHHGSMSYMERHVNLREDPNLLHPGTLRVISLRYDYLPDAYDAEKLLSESDKAYISRYALGRDYHKLIRKKLSALCDVITEHSGFKQHRAFVDSAPILERGFAEKAGLGWIGKNTMLINSRTGSWFFLGEILTDAPLPISTPQETTHCGSCTRCLDICPTNAFVNPWELDARRCISYLTIENKGPIPEQLRPMMGNRIYGCDDCQLVCPWNKFAQLSVDADFQARHQLDHRDLIDLFEWTEIEFLEHTAGSPIRRIGHTAWMRNIAVAMGNADYSEAIVTSLYNKQTTSDMLKEHILWAISQQTKRKH
ncbi:MAG: tRNA epoxyqueuosine(34) reductase QueG [Pseudomonadota bacterium]